MSHKKRDYIKSVYEGMTGMKAPNEKSNMHVNLPSGAIANVSTGASPQLLDALDKMCKLANKMSDQSAGEEFIRWAMKHCRLKEVYDQFEFANDATGFDTFYHLIVNKINKIFSERLELVTKIKPDDNK